MVKDEMPEEVSAVIKGLHGLLDDDAALESILSDMLLKGVLVLPASLNKDRAETLVAKTKTTLRETLKDINAFMFIVREVKKGDVDAVAKVFFSAVLEMVIKLGAATQWSLAGRN